MLCGVLFGGCGSDAATTDDADAGKPGNMAGDAGSTMDAGIDGATKTDLRLPLITPPVKAATPPALGGTGVRVQAARRELGEVWGQELALDSVDIKQRFFTAGPTSVFQILGMLDMRITEINQRVQSSEPACLRHEPIAYTLSPFGQSVTFYAQCVESMSAPGASAPAFLQFGRKDGVSYLFIAGGAQHVAARLTPAAATDAGATEARWRVDVWIGVGHDNVTRCGTASQGFECGSYGVIELHTDETRLALELTAAGTGFGYCGAQLKSDGARVYTRGSLDMGATCLDTSTLCVEASDLTTPASCESAITTFATPALGRKAFTGKSQGFGASLYPGGASNQVTLDGTSADSLRFGPTSPTSGVAAFASTPSGP